MDNIKCKIECGFSNEKYKKQLYDSSGLIYQSGLEKRFIENAINLGYNIENGPVIDYFHNNKWKKYYIDFYIPEERILVEVKSKNYYYKLDINSGRLQAKCEYAENYAKKHNMIFVMLFDDDINDLSNTINMIKIQNR